MVLIANFLMVTQTSMIDMNMKLIKKVNTIISSINLRMKMAIAVITKIDEANNIEMAFIIYDMHTLKSFRCGENGFLGHRHPINPEAETLLNPDACSL